jgi:hypothetical protein
MPKNRLIYYGLILLVGTVGLWIGVELARRIIWLLPYLGGLAVLMIAIGAAYEYRRRGRAPSNEP